MVTMVFAAHCANAVRSINPGALEIHWCTIVLHIHKYFTQLENIVRTKETPPVAMSSSKTDSSTNKRQKNPEIKIVDTSFGRFKITEETKDTEEDHPNNHDPNVIKKDVKNPLRIRLEYK